MKRRVPLVTAATAVLAGGVVAAVVNLGAAGASAAGPAGPGRPGDTLTLSSTDGTSVTQLAGPVSVDGFNFQLDPTTTGSQSGGSGAGKVTFEPLQVIVSDLAPTSALQTALLQPPTGQTLIVKIHAVQGAGPAHATDYTFKLVTPQKLTIAQTSGSPAKETIDLQYGGVQITSGSN